VRATQSHLLTGELASKAPRHPTGWEGNGCRADQSRTVRRPSLELGRQVWQNVDLYGLQLSLLPSAGHPGFILIGIPCRLSESSRDFPWRSFQPSCLTPEPAVCGVCVAPCSSWSPLGAIPHWPGIHVHLHLCCPRLLLPDKARQELKKCILLCNLPFRNTICLILGVPRM
jgi:hypothetical protein